VIKLSRIWFCAIVLPVALLTLTSCSSQSGASQSVDPLSDIKSLPDVAATVNGQSINTAQVVDQAFVDGGPAALGALIDYKLLDQAADAHHITVSESEMTSKRNEFIAGMGADNYASQVALHHINQVFVDNKIKHDIILEKLTSLELPQNDLMLHVRHILIATMPTHRGVDLHKPHSSAEALAILGTIQGQLKKGASFADLARKYSEDPYTRANGGDLGIIDQHSDPFSGTVWNAASGLKNGQVNLQAAHSYLGYHLIQVVSWSTSPLKSDSQDYLNLEKRTTEFELTRMMNGTMARLRSSAKVEERLYGPGVSPIQSSN